MADNTNKQESNNREKNSIERRKKTAWEAAAAGAGTGAAVAAGIKYSDDIIQFVAGESEGEPEPIQEDLENSQIHQDEVHSITTSATFLANSEPLSSPDQATSHGPEAETVTTSLQPESVESGEIAAERDTEEIIEGLYQPDIEDDNVIDAVITDSDSNEILGEIYDQNEWSEAEVYADEDDYVSPDTYEPEAVDDDFTGPESYKLDGDDEVFPDEAMDGCI